MTIQKRTPVEWVGVVLVLLMALLQAGYAIFATLDPQAFSELRGTELFALGDADWVVIYASRTLFVALIIGFLLIRREYNILFWAALFGTVMPVADALLAYQADAESTVVFKHVATIFYLLATCFVLRRITGDGNDVGQ